MKIILASEFPDIFEKTKSLFPDPIYKKVLLINTAAMGEGIEPNYLRNIKPFEDMGYEVETFDLATMDGLQEKLSTSDICYVAGGNTYYLLKYAKDKNLKEELLRRFSDSEFFYIGSSAGAIIMSPDIDFISPMDDKSQVEIQSTEGLNFIPFSFLPHIGHATMGQAAEEIKSIYPESGAPLFAFNDMQALYIDGNKIEIL